LIHGTLTSHPLTGLLLPIATAMNAVTIFRLFTRLFLGKRRTGFTVMADALPRERWILAASVLFVVLGGLFPNAIVVQRSAEADIVEQTIHTSASLDQLRRVDGQPENRHLLPRLVKASNRKFVTESQRSAPSTVTLGVEDWKQRASEPIDDE